ncbi:PIM1 kinase, partial [Paradoxornis webbianus]|nr:PIM1 kinase [Sinosuthora webbiana]
AGKEQEALQEQQQLGWLLGRSGFSSSYSGTCRADSTPVADPWHGFSPTDGIVVLPQPNSTCASLGIELLDKVSTGLHGVVQLLDWFELLNNFLLVVEHP